MGDADVRSAESGGSRFEAWEVVLDRIELDVIRVERVLDTGAGLDRVDEWHVPDDYGPIPGALRPRAEQIRARQQELLPRLAERLGVTTRHQAILDGVERVSARPDQAVYIDVTA